MLVSVRERKVVKTVKHDGEVLQALVDTTRMDERDGFNHVSEEVVQMISDWQQKLNRSKHVREEHVH